MSYVETKKHIHSHAHTERTFSKDKIRVLNTSYKSKLRHTYGDYK